MKLKKEIRQEVYLKCNGHCGYCGLKIEYKQMQVDHIEAIFHNMTESKANGIGRSKGEDSITNYMPSCRRCNFRKAEFTLEDFRSQIGELKTRLMRDAPNYRMALDYGLIKEQENQIEFYFETLLNGVKNSEAGAEEND